MTDRRDPARVGAELLARRDPGSGFDRLVPAPLSELADAAPLAVEPVAHTATLLEWWVQWLGPHRPSLYHVRVSTGGMLLCGIVSPLARAATANSFPPRQERCGLCLLTLKRIGVAPMEPRP